jgi:hypothetical protein
MYSIRLLPLIFQYLVLPALPIKLPVNTSDRNLVNTLELSDIGTFGLMRKERPGVPAHYHTGIDIKRPNANYVNEPIYPVAEGRVISIRRDGPYAQVIVEHELNVKFWTIYEHISEIKVSLNDHVDSDSPIARFMNRKELDRYGWQFDHFHLEILKEAPLRLERDPVHPDRHYASYTLICHTLEELNTYFYNPLEFLSGQGN